jgi:hypothetical protein
MFFQKLSKYQELVSFCQFLPATFVVFAKNLSIVLPSLLKDTKIWDIKNYLVTTRSKNLQFLPGKTLFIITLRSIGTNPQLCLNWFVFSSAKNRE